MKLQKDLLKMLKVKQFLTPSRLSDVIRAVQDISYFQTDIFLTDVKCELQFWTKHLETYSLFSTICLHHK